MTNHDAIDVKGDAATGIFAQSVGGGGGDGGGALTVLGMLTDTTNADSRAVTATVAIGGGGGDGNDGGDVTVDNTGSITTHGVSGYGVFAQSVGGGGGIGGRANTFQLVVADQCTVPVLCSSSPSAKNNFALGVTIGGDGGGANDGGAVTVNNTGAIETFGNASDGIYAQSIGGGGGNGGNGILGSGEILPIPAELAFVPVGALSFYKNIQVVVGGSGGSSGNGGTVDVHNDKNITTHGSNSNAIFAQSVGGGGGVGGKAAIGLTGTFGLGGAGGAAGDGGDVSVDQHGGATIETFGTASNGIFAQSIGGGGGVAGNVDRVLTPKIETPIPGLTIPALNVGTGLALGRSGGGGGDGGHVDVDVDGQIITHGDNAAGVFAQSVGGGGGVLGELGTDIIPFLTWQIGSAGAAGNAGQVDVDLTGTIMTAGNNATGIFAQSAGGQGTAGAVNVTLNSSILTGALLAHGDASRGLGSIGIFAQSVASDNANNGNITVVINSTDGVVQGGRSQVVDADRAYIGVGIWVMDGNDNTITNKGLVTTLGGVFDGFAILGTGSDDTHLGGNEVVSNFGTVTGSFDLGAGTNSYTNEVDSFLNAGKFAYVGDGNLLLNHGRMSPGGDGTVLTTEVLGNWQQSATGTYGVDLDLWWTGDTGVPSKEADRVNVIGATSGTADLTGIVDLMPLSKANALPGDHEVVIVSAVNGISIATQSNLVLVAPPSAVASYELLYPNPNDIVLGYTIDFSPGGLNRNQTALGGYINRIQLALPRPTDDPGADKNTPLGPLVTALFDLPNVPSLQNAYDQLSPEIYADMQIAALYASLDFSNNLLSCRVNGTYTASINREGQCLWVGAKARFLDSDRTSETIGFDETAALFAAGAQVALDPVWRLGFGVGYQKSWLETDTGAESDGDQVQGGIALKYNPGALLLAGVVSGGRGWYDTTRPMAFGSFAETAVGDHEIDVLAGRLHASYVFGSPSLYFKPLIDAAATRLDLDVTETGAGVASLVVHGGDNTVYSVSPALEVGTEWWLANGTLIRPFVRVGVTWFSDDDVTVAASFAGAPSGVAPFSILVEMDEVQADVAAGIEMISGQDSALRLYYDGHFGDTIKIHSVGLKASVKF